jgi:hypothetical protein
MNYKYNYILLYYKMHHKKSITKKTKSTNLQNKKVIKKAPVMVYYTGIGAKKNGIHTKEEFLKIMNKNFVDDDKYYKLYKINIYNPNKLKQLTFNKWIEWSGASIRNN